MFTPHVGFGRKGRQKDTLKEQDVNKVSNMWIIYGEFWAYLYLRPLRKKEFKKYSVSVLSTHSSINLNP